MKKQIKKAAKTKAKKVRSTVKAKSKKAVATKGTVRAKAKKLATKLRHVKHDAKDVATRIGSTMETIGGALMSLVTPGHEQPERN